MTIKEIFMSQKEGVFWTLAGMLSGIAFMLGGYTVLCWIFNQAVYSLIGGK
jgi:hypothetical protein